MYQKHYDPTGRAKAVFSIENEKGVREFTGKDPSEFEIVDDPAFGKGYVVPCTIDYGILKEDEF